MVGKRLLCLLLTPIIIASLPSFFDLRHTDANDSVASYAVYCIGDSLTAADYFEAELRTLLGANCAVVNKGIAGSPTTGMLNRFNTDVLRYDPDFVVIWGGVNDISGGTSLATIKSNLQSMYTRAHNAGIMVIAIAMSPWKGHAKWTTLKQTNTNNLRTWIETIAVNVDYVIDIYPSLADSDDPDALAPAYDCGDHLHFNNAGGAVIGQAIYDAVFATYIPAIAEPSNLAPVDGAIGVSQTTTLQSTAFSASDADSYHAASQWKVRLSSGTYSSPVYDSGVSDTNLTTITVPPGILKSNTTYYWEVTHWDNLGDRSSYSAETSFTTIAVPPPLAPTLVSPANGTSVTGTSVTFEWNSVAGAVKYRLLVSRGSGTLDTTKYKRNVYLVGEAATTYTDTGYPANGTKYYWWVWAYAGDGSSSLWAQVSANGSNFTNTSSYIAAPILVSPANGATVTDTSVTFQWNAVAGAVRYQLLVSRSTAILDSTKYKRQVYLDGEATTTYVDTGYPANGIKYYWWVWAYHSDGSYSVLSEVSANGRWFINTA